MVFRGRLGSIDAVVSVKHTSVSLGLGDGWVGAWDLGGRLYSVWREGHTFRRGLSGSVLHKWRDPSIGGASGYDARQRLWLTESDADALVDEAAGYARAACGAIVSDPGGWSNEVGVRPPAEVTAVLELGGEFDAPAARDDAARFAQIYRPIGMLPPDLYLSVVLQVTEGCSFGSCTFCDLYHDGYRVKPPDEFRRHVAAVADYLGASIALRVRSIFLGSANALAVPMARLVAGLRTNESRSSSPDSRPTYTRCRPSVRNRA